MTSADARHAPRQDLAALLHKLGKNVGTLVVDEVHFLDAKLADFLFAEILALAARTTARTAGSTRTAFAARTATAASTMATRTTVTASALRMTRSAALGSALPALLLLGRRWGCGWRCLFLFL